MWLPNSKASPMWIRIILYDLSDSLFRFPVAKRMRGYHAVKVCHECGRRKDSEKIVG